MIDPATGTAIPVAAFNDLQPDSDWSDEALIEYGQRALNAADNYEKQANILTRKTVVQRFPRRSCPFDFEKSPQEQGCLG